MSRKENIVVKTATGNAKAIFVAIKPIVKYDPDGLSHANVRLSKEDGERIVKMANQVGKEQYEKFRKNNKKIEFTGCIPLVNIEKDENGKIIKETPDPDGAYILKSKCKAYIKNGVASQKVPVFDSKLNQMENVNIGAGSTVRLGITLEGYSTNLGTGVSVKLRMVQVIDLVAFGGYKATDFFTETEGYEFSEENNSSEVEDDEDVDF